MDGTVPKRVRKTSLQLQPGQLTDLLSETGILMEERPVPSGSCTSLAALWKRAGQEAEGDSATAELQV